MMTPPPSSSRRRWFAVAALLLGVLALALAFREVRLERVVRLLARVGPVGAAPAPWLPNAR